MATASGNAFEATLRVLSEGTLQLYTLISSDSNSQQNSYSISYLLGTVTTIVTMYSHGSLVPDTVTTEQ